ncbi:MAG: PTS sugar transporter subunit IIC [Deltaproteobacteria bacterium]|nr:PTS sugar transporter subunit IIC [Deltaproteobacteria bacterium]
MGIIWQSFLVSLVGGLLSLDRTAAFQIMVSRPIVTAPIIGYILGDAAIGLLIGVMLELLFVGGLPIGGYIPPHEVMITVLITAISLMGQNVLNSIGFDRFPWKFAGSDMVFVLGAALLMMLPLDVICKKVDVIVRNLNIRFFNAAMAELNKGGIQGIVGNNLKGLGVFFSLNFITLFVLNLAGVMIVYFFFLFLPVTAIMALPLACASVFIIGLSSVYNTSYGRSSLPVFLGAVFFAVIILTMVIGR